MALDQHRGAIVSPGDFPELFKFSRHIPPILLKQTMSIQAFNFFKKHANSFSIDFSSSPYLTPSIERFWGALLFVDISGFTALSTKMNVDDLRIHINAYFEKIISYADKYEGQTVKFAGDALYIIWQSPVYDLPDDPYGDLSISEDVVQRATACALEINKNLSDYKVVFTPSFGITTSSMVDAENSHHGEHPTNEEVAYLNVHSGLSVGMMAGLDVGANDRWEFLLVGSPLGDVALAEDCASKGELIISEKAHNVLHPNVHNDSGSGSSGSPASGGSQSGEMVATSTATAGMEPALVVCTEIGTSKEALPTCRCVLRKEGCYLVHKDTTINPASMNMMTKHTATSSSGNGGNGGQIGLNSSNSSSLPLLTESSTSASGRRVSSTYTSSNLLDVNTNYNKRICTIMVDCFLEAFEAWRNALVNGVSSLPSIHQVNSGSPTNASTIGTPKAGSSSALTTPASSSLVMPCRELQEEEQLSIQDLKNELMKILRHELTSTVSTTNVPFGSTSPNSNSGNSSSNGFPSISTTAAVLDQFRTWAFNTISATIAAHVHQTARDGFDFTILRHLQTFSEVITTYNTTSVSNGPSGHNRSLSMAVASPTHRGHGMHGHGHSVTMSSMIEGSGSGSNRRGRFRGASQDLPSMRLGSSVISAPSHMEADLTAELRNVIVLFIKIDMNFGDWMKNHSQPGGANAAAPIITTTMPASTPMGNQRSNSMFLGGGGFSSSGGGAGFQMKEKDMNPIKIPKYYFLNRSRQELGVDYLLLQKFQKCMDILTTIFMEKGGQLRQFIVDDKGTVCIGTFGLRGAVNYDDAAAAIEAAKSIIVQLREAKMNAGIGITSGKAYCGLVGSPTRHEYAVMGPSVNLSARLMSKAPYLNIYCDDETKLRDRVHAFKDHGEITAKGYSNPVRIYSPILGELNRHNNSGSSSSGSASVGSVNNILAATAPVNGSSGGANSSTTGGPNVGSGMGIVISNSTGTILPNSLTRTGGDTFTSPIAGGGGQLRRRRVRNSFLTEHLRSSFNINSEANVSLYGRKVEIDTLLRYLLRKVSSHMSPHSPSHTNNLPQIDLTANPLFVCIAGVCGIGKTVFLNEICRVIAKVNENNLKVAVFRKRISSYSSSEPFHAWRSIFREMMAFLFKIEPGPGNNARRNAGSGEDAAPAEISSVDQVLQGVKIIEGAMSDAGDIMSLLSSINFLPIESDITSDIESLGPLSLLRSVDLLAKIVQTFVSKTKHLVVIAFDDLQWIDFYSWLLIQKVWTEDKGAVLLTTYQTVSAGRVNKRNISTSTFVNVQETFLDPDRTLIMDLNPIDAAAIELLVKEVLERNNYPTVSKEKLYTLIFELSGGNPLYAYELIKVCVDQALHNSQKVKEDPSLCAFVKDFKSNRVEEVIYFRFDQLDSASQTVLKVSSIICVFGAPISVPMLEFLILEDANNGGDESELDDGTMGDLRRQGSLTTNNRRNRNDELAITTINVVAVLRDLLSHNEFLSIVVRERADGTMSSSSGTEERKPFIPQELLNNGDKNGAGGIHMEQLALLDDTVLREMHFEFSASIEQHAIYDLMLEDQKHYLHRRVANYYEKVFESRRGGRGTPAELFECGLHLESASRYHEAFPYFYRSASILSNLGSAQLCHQQLDRAHKLLRQMKANLTFSSDSPSISHGNSNHHAVVTISPRSNGNSTTSSSGVGAMSAIIDESSILQDNHHHHHTNSNNATSGRHRRSLSDITRALQSTDEEPSGLMQISKQDAFKMFQGRVDLLETAISIMLKIAQFKLLTFQEVNAAATYYEEAFHLILIALANVEEAEWNETYTNTNKNHSQTTATTTSLSLIESDSEDDRKVVSIINGRYYWKETSYENFYLQDYSLLFRALSGIIFLYRLGYIKDDSSSGKECEAIKWFLYLSSASTHVYCNLNNILATNRTCANTNTSTTDYFLPLEYVGLAFKFHHLYGSNQVNEANSVMKKIMLGYAVTNHSKDILQVNFFDPVPATVCVALQYEVLHKKDDVSVNHIMSFIMSMIREINHSSTMAMVMIPLCTSLVLLKRCEEAFDIYHKFYISLDEEAHVLNKFTDIKKPFYEWLRLMKHADSNGIDLPGDDGDASYYFPNKFLLRVLNNPKTRHTLARIRPITHSCCDFTGVGKEFINASILFFHVLLALKFNKGAKPTAKDEPLDKCLIMAKYYIDQSISNTAVRPDSYFFCRVMSLLLKIRIIAMICKRNPIEFPVDETEREVSQCFSILEGVLAIKSERFVYLDEMVTKLHVEAMEMIHSNDKEKEGATIAASTATAGTTV